MTKPIKIDFVSDVACPWCVEGLGELETALERVGDLVDAEIRFQPFELNPNMSPEGQNRIEHVAQKYGSTRAQMDANRKVIRDRAAAVGFTMTFGEGSRIHNTFDAHRLLHWAGLVGKQTALKHALFEANFTADDSLADPQVLVRAAVKAGLDPAEARDVLTAGRYADEVREAEHTWRAAGISSVPAVIINDRYLISGGQPAEVFEQALRRVAAES
ncbi:DsbA family oxidoreductase [Caulobacter segnis]|uniref:DsbA family oxidoreductase n=1 Tax=Caulobacter segnis TaxID=88688 RepID=UPI0028653789|nr:DsbA family oxidoreductase [Caulobacter segnis]MDR6624404.1 putative DsbA family dithiol-disulfide isomerase [Caulobacter segnis]